MDKEHGEAGIMLKETTKSPWTVDVDVYLESDGSKPKFRIESYLQNQPNGDLVFYNNGRPGFIIFFHLHDETNSSYLFPSPSLKDEALWSKEGKGCPPDDYGRQWDQFTALRVEPDRKTLVVRNLNDTKIQFGYTLRVTKDDGAHYLPLDPGGDNQNGSATKTQSG